MEMKFNKVHTSKDLTISALILAAGIGLYFINSALGVFTFLFGIIMLLLYKAGYKKEGDDSLILSKNSVDIARSCRSSLMDYLKGKDVEPIIDPNQNEGIIRIELYYNLKESVAYIQLFDFANYRYEPSTQIVELSGKRAEKIIKKIV